MVALLKSLCLVYKHYSVFGLNHGDIQPQTVHIDFYKLPQVLDNPVLFPSGASNLAKSVFDSAYISALSPLQAEMLRAGVTSSTINSTDDLWGIAVTVLCYASLRPLEHFYARQGSSIIVTHINEALGEGLQQAQDTARKEIFALLSKMLSHEPYKRPGVDQILMHPFLRSARTDINLENLEDVQFFGFVGSPSVKQSPEKQLQGNRFEFGVAGPNRPLIKKTTRPIFDQPTGEVAPSTQTPISALIQEIRARMNNTPYALKDKQAQVSKHQEGPLNEYGTNSETKRVRVSQDTLTGLASLHRGSPSLQLQHTQKTSVPTFQRKILPSLDLSQIPKPTLTRPHSSRGSIGPKLPLFVASPRSKLLEEKAAEVPQDPQVEGSNIFDEYRLASSGTTRPTGIYSRFSKSQLMGEHEIPQQDQFVGRPLAVERLDISGMHNRSHSTNGRASFIPSPRVYQPQVNLLSSSRTFGYSSTPKHTRSNTTGNY